MCDKQLYVYNMKYRPFGLCCQPDGWVAYREDASRWGHIVYDRELTAEECYDYELEFVAKEKA